MRRQAATREHERDTLLVGIFIAALSVTTRILIALGIRHVHSKRQAAITAGDESTDAPGDKPAAGGASRSRSRDSAHPAEVLAKANQATAPPRPP